MQKQCYLPRGSTSLLAVGKGMTLRVFLFLLFFLICIPNSYGQSGSTFWPYWGDGRAEVSIYDVKVPRYGQLRSTKDVLLFVTEDFDKQRLVKSNKKDEHSVPVLKLNHVRRFQTGLYDYALMLSVFSPLTVGGKESERRKAITPLKTSLSVSEWCGNYFETVESQSQYLIRRFHSYLEMEGDGTDKFRHGSEVIFEDDLLVRMRELVAAFPSGTYQILTSSLYGRLQQFTPSLEKVDVRRTISPEKEETPLGPAKVIRYTVSFPNRSLEVAVLAEKGRQILSWVRSYGSGKEATRETAILQSSERLPYWKLQGQEGAKLRQSLGILPSFNAQ